MATLYLINPSSRSKGKGKRMAKRHRRIPPRNAKGRFIKRGHSSSRKPRRSRSHTVHRHHFRKFRTVSLTVRKPRRRRHHSVARKHHRRRNPIGSGFVGMLKNAAVGAVGAVVVEKALSYVPLQFAATLMSGQMQYVTKTAGAVILGALGKAAGVSRWTTPMVEGSLVVTLYQALHNEVLPRIGMAGLGYWGSGMVAGDTGGAQGYLSGMNEHVTVGEYVGPRAGMQGLGEHVTY